MACIHYYSVVIHSLVVLLICLVCIITMVFVVIFLLFCCDHPLVDMYWYILRLYLFLLYFQHESRNSILPGTTLAPLIDTACYRLGCCYTLLCLSNKTLHTLCILIGMQHPYDKCFSPIHIPKSLLEKSSCGTNTETNCPGPSIEYSGSTTTVETLGLINLSIVYPLELP